MKRIILNALLFFIAALLLVAYLNMRQNGKGIIRYGIGGKTYRLLVAKTPAEWEKGLMNVKNLPQADGMLFVFPEKQARTFWNKNTLLDLELAWLDGDKVIGRSFLPSIERSKETVYVSSPGPVDKVAEIVVRE